MNEQPAASGDFLLSHPVSANGGEDACLRNGEQYRQSLRDGRRVIMDGEVVEDVTSQPGLKAGIDTFATLFDAQFEPDTREVTTSIDPVTGRRYRHRLAGAPPPRGPGAARRPDQVQHPSHPRGVRSAAGLRPGQGQSAFSRFVI